MTPSPSSANRTAGCGRSTAAASVPTAGPSSSTANAALSTIPLTGALAVAVPGRTGRARPRCSRRRHPRAGRSLGAGRAAAENGLPCSAKTRDDVRRSADRGRRRPRTGVRCSPRRPLPQVGDAAARSATWPLDPCCSRAIRDGFYTGAFAERAVAALRGGGAPFSGEEWAAGADVRPEAAISGHYAGACHPPDAAAHARMDGAPAGGALRRRGGSHRAHRAGRRSHGPGRPPGLRDRLRDLRHRQRRVDETCSPPAAVGAASARLDGHRASSGAFSVIAGDTTSTVAVDADGRAVSFIHSLAFTFGAKIDRPRHRESC